MSTIVFVGPTLPKGELPIDDCIEFRPPAACGDIFKAVSQMPTAIGLVDGYFETSASPWHKEILWALSQGIAVFGSSSMGALRAAELGPFGMIGVGQVFAAYRDGLIEDDDEVAIQHGPEETGYLVLSEALVNVRASLSLAQQHGILSDIEAETLITCAKGLFYKDREWDAILVAGERKAINEQTLRNLRDWLPTGRVNIKTQDAHELIRMMLEWHPGNPRREIAEFPRTVYWNELLHRISREIISSQV
jgi:hypothetical protein